MRITSSRAMFACIVLAFFGAVSAETTLSDPEGTFGWDTPARDGDLLAVGTWNLLHLTKERFTKNKKLAKHLTDIMKTFDLIGVVEIDELETLDILKKELSGFEYITSGTLPFNGKYVEAATYFYRKSKVEPDPAIPDAVWAQPGAVPIAKDETFRRPPYLAAWKTTHANPARFVTGLMHALWGDGDMDPRSEMRHMGNIALSLARRLSPETDVILMGDFNLPPEEPEWDSLRVRQKYTPMIVPPHKTTATNRSLLDNLWLSESMFNRLYKPAIAKLGTRASYGMWNIWPSYDYKTVDDAREDFTDHRPLWVMLTMDEPMPQAQRATSLVDLKFDEPDCGHMSHVLASVPCDAPEAPPPDEGPSIFDAANSSVPVDAPDGSFAWGFPPDVPNTLKVGAWNLMHLTKDRLRSTILKRNIVAVMKNFDLIGLVEIDEIECADTLLKELGSKWGYINSHKLPLRSQYAEHYVYFYQKAKVEPNPKVEYSLWRENGTKSNGKSNEWFIRTPLLAAWQGVGNNKLDFVTGLYHIKWGDGVFAPRKEVQKLGELSEVLGGRIAPEADVIFMGDFNLPPHAAEWDHLRVQNKWTPMFVEPNSTSTTNSSLLDNLWLSPTMYNNLYMPAANAAAAAGKGSYGLWNTWPSFDDYKDATEAREKFADHRPTWLLLSTEKDVDPPIVADNLRNLDFVRTAFGPAV